MQLKIDSANIRCWTSGSVNSITSRSESLYLLWDAVHIISINAFIQSDGKIEDSRGNDRNSGDKTVIFIQPLVYFIHAILTFNTVKSFSENALDFAIVLQQKCEMNLINVSLNAIPLSFIPPGATP